MHSRRCQSQPTLSQPLVALGADGETRGGRVRIRLPLRGGDSLLGQRERGKGGGEGGRPPMPVDAHDTHNGSEQTGDVSSQRGGAQRLPLSSVTVSDPHASHAPLVCTECGCTLDSRDMIPQHMEFRYCIMSI
ncbi:hypothetical protein KIPB_013886 [Kipferlia bialata]|uniref:Uncharacterized protein n=1 Tax=Kipferlia bialata TaxID=797122 RepID=A0A391P1M9_9EUKA|nr:hypothetical protein KIPB_013886 [Kipferlia bialata]|eukprot:g13886.t1